MLYFLFLILKNNQLKKNNQTFFKQVLKPHEASSVTEDYADDVAKHRECDSSFTKENKGVWTSILNRSFWNNTESSW